MTKFEFLEQLSRELKRISEEERDNILDFYDNYIKDKMADGFSEAEAVSSLGTVKSVANNAMVELIADKKEKKGISSAIVVLLLIFSTPILVPLGIAILAVYFAIAVTIIALVASFGAVSLGGLALVVLAPLNLTSFPTVIVVIGVGLVLFAVFAVLTVLIAFCGFKFMHLITVELAKFIVKRGKNK